jgi:hypothetical protein
VKLVRLSEPVISAAVWHVVPDRVADLLEGEQLAHDRQLEWPVVVLNHNQNKLNNTLSKSNTIKYIVNVFGNQIKRLKLTSFVQFYKPRFKLPKK